MKNLRQWLPLFKASLYVLWLLWALQINFSEISNDVNGKDLRLNAEKSRRANLFLGNLVEKARSKKENYSPKDYYDDLRLIQEENLFDFALCPFASNLSYSINDLWEIVFRNDINDHYTWGEIDREGDAYNKWELENGYRRKPENLKWRKVFPWLNVFYLRTLFLVTILYLSRMYERKDKILNVILREKIKFLSAIIVWPVFLYKYPYNIVREIRTEAELRRTKGLFSKLSLRDMYLVRKIANSDNYHSWIEDRRQVVLQTGLFVAIIATLLIHFFSIFEVRRRSSPIKEIVLIVSISNAPVCETSDILDCDNQFIREKDDLLERKVCLGVVYSPEWIFSTRSPEIIDYVPRSSPFGTVNRLINRIVKGKDNEDNNTYLIFPDVNLGQQSLCG